MKTNHHNTRKARISLMLKYNCDLVMANFFERKTIEDDDKQLQLLKDLHKKHATKK
jgi:hypothetical protein